MFNKRIFNVFNAYFKVNGVTLFTNENLTSASLAREVQEAIIRNGISNKVWSKLEYDATLNVEMGTNVMDFSQIAMACGSSIVSGAHEDYTMAKVYTIAEGKITLGATPVKASEIEIVRVDTDEILEETTHYTIAGNDVTFKSITGDVKVLPYKTMVQNAQVIDISSDKFSEAGELVLKTYAVDENAKITEEITVVIPKAKPSSNFSISTSSDVSNGNDNTITVTALDSEGSFGKIISTPYVKK